MRKPALPVAVTLAAIVLLSTQAQENEPRDVGLTESAEQRLLQVDVSVRGPADEVSALTPEDFELVVAGNVIEDVIVDRTCAGDVERARELAASQGAEIDDMPVAGATLLIYLDEFHLTIHGRHEAVKTAREFVRDELHAPDRAMIVSGGRYVRVYSDLTSDTDVLLAALDELEADATQIETYASLEERRVDEVYRALIDVADMKQTTPMGGIGRVPDKIPSGSTGNLSGGRKKTRPSAAALAKLAAPTPRNYHQIVQSVATAVARQKQAEERAITAGALERLAVVLDRIAYAQPPKAVLYFADRMRSNPGDHYWEMLNVGSSLSEAGTEFVQVAHGASSNAFDALIDAAAARGVRFYTVQAEGLVATPPTGPYAAGIALTAGSPVTSRNRIQDAKAALLSLARETGGRAFLHGGGTAEAISQQLKEDLDCVYLLSFPPGELPTDRALQVLVNVRPSGLQTRYRSRVWAGDIVHDPEDELRAALATSRLAEDVGAIRLGVVPTGFSGGKFTALVQAAVAPATEGGAEWELGLAASQRGTPHGDWSQTVRTNQPGVPVVLEAVGEFGQGIFEITAIARDVRTGQIVSARHVGEWPDPRAVGPALGPLAVIQPSVGAFSRGDETRTSGSLIFGKKDWLRSEQPAAVIGIVCRGAADNDDLIVRRTLSGDDKVEFADISFAGSDDRCHLFIDQIRAGTLTSGYFDFEVDVLERNEPASSTKAEITVISAEEMQAVSRP